MSDAVYDSFSQANITIPYNKTSGQVKTTCPNCKDKRSHPEDKSLSVNIDDGIFHCHYCGWSGRIKNKAQISPSKRTKSFVRPTSPTTEIKANSGTLNWFYEERGISPATLAKAKVTESVENIGGNQKRCVCFNYFANGELLNIKYRTRDKQFKFTSGAELLPYNLDSIKDVNSVYIVEGEIDALSLIEVGIGNVISCPSGANKNLSWMDEWWDTHFEDKIEVIIAVDTDNKGVEFKQALIQRFRPEVCKVVSDWGEGCKDANDVLVKHGHQALLKRLKSAEDVRVSGVFTIKDFEPDLNALKEYGLSHGLTLGLGDFDTHISWVTKHLCVVTGKPGSGKSEFVDEIVMRLNLRHNFKAAYFSPENHPVELHVAKLIERFCGVKCNYEMPEIMFNQAKEYLMENIFYIYPDEGNYLNFIIEKARWLVRKKNIKVLVIDPFNKLESQQGNRSETLYINELLTALTRTAIELDLLIFLVAHPRKPEKYQGKEITPTLYDISGSSHFYNQASFGLIVERNYQDEYTLVRVAKVKQRQWGRLGEIKFSFNMANGRYAPYVNGVKQEGDSSNYISQKIQNREVQLSFACSDPDPKIKVAPEAELKGGKPELFMK